MEQEGKKSAQEIKAMLHYLSINYPDGFEGNLDRLTSELLSLQSGDEEAEQPKEDNRCQYEKIVEKYFGLPEEVKETDVIKTDFGQLVSLVAMAVNSYSKEDVQVMSAKEFLKLYDPKGQEPVETYDRQPVEDIMESYARYVGSFSKEQGISDEEINKLAKDLDCGLPDSNSKDDMMNAALLYEKYEGFVIGYKAAIKSQPDKIRMAIDEWKLSEKAHDITIEQLRKTQEQRNMWEELCNEMLKEMDAAEWVSPVQEEARAIIKASKIRSDVQKYGDG